MSNLESMAEPTAEPTAERSDHLDSGYGIGGWLGSRDHRQIALMFLSWTATLFLYGALQGLYLKAKVLGGGALDPAVINQMRTYHGIAMVFLVVIPIIPSVLGYFLLPLQIGARNLALPTLSRASLLLYVLGSVLFMASLAVDPVGTGWRFTLGYASVDTGAFGLLAAGMILVAASWVATGTNFIVTIHLMRAPDVYFRDLPVASWSFYLSGYVLVISGLIFGTAIFLRAFALLYGQGLFNADISPLVWQNLFWFVTTPAAFFALVPAAGIITEVIAGISGRPVFGYRTVVASLVALVAVSFLSWGVRLIGSGQAAVTSFVFAALSLLAVIPVALITYCWLATLYRAAVVWSAATVYVLAFVLNAGIAAMMSLLLSNLTVGNYLDSTLFTTAHTHYVMIGGVITALLAGLHHWWPQITGRAYDEKRAQLAAFLYAIGVNLAFFPQIILGTNGMPRGFPDFAREMAGVQAVSATGMLVLLAGLILIAMNLVKSVLSGAEVERSSGADGSLVASRPSAPPR